MCNCFYINPVIEPFNSHLQEDFCVHLSSSVLFVFFLSTRTPLDLIKKQDSKSLSQLTSFSAPTITAEKKWGQNEVNITFNDIITRIEMENN